MRWLDSASDFYELKSSEDSESWEACRAADHRVTKSQIQLGTEQQQSLLQLNLKDTKDKKQRLKKNLTDNSAAKPSVF